MRVYVPVVVVHTSPFVGAEGAVPGVTRKPAALVALYQMPGANAIEAAEGAKKVMERLKEHGIALDIDQSAKEFLVEKGFDPPKKGPSQGPIGLQRSPHATPPSRNSTRRSAGNFPPSMSTSKA